MKRSGTEEVQEFSRGVMKDIKDVISSSCSAAKLAAVVNYSIFI